MSNLRRQANSDSDWLIHVTFEGWTFFDNWFQILNMSTSNNQVFAIDFSKLKFSVTPTPDEEEEDSEEENENFEDEYAFMKVSNSPAQCNI